MHAGPLVLAKLGLVGRGEKLEDELFLCRQMLNCCVLIGDRTGTYRKNVRWAPSTLNKFLRSTTSVPR